MISIFDMQKSAEEDCRRRALAAARSSAYANNLSVLVNGHPRVALVTFVLGIVLAGLMVWSFEVDRPRREAENAAWWKTKLECRQAGGSFEYFGTQGYHCVGGRQK